MILLEYKCHFLDEYHLYFHFDESRNINEYVFEPTSWYLICVNASHFVYICVNFNRVILNVYLQFSSAHMDRLSYSLKLTRFYQFRGSLFGQYFSQQHDWFLSKGIIYIILYQLPLFTDADHHLNSSQDFRPMLRRTVWTVGWRRALSRRGASGLSSQTRLKCDVCCGLLIAPRKPPLTPHLNSRIYYGAVGSLTHLTCPQFQAQGTSVLTSHPKDWSTWHGIEIRWHNVASALVLNPGPGSHIPAWKPQRCRALTNWAIRDADTWIYPHATS